jgi:DNA-binding response OmpR family regulator
MEGVAGGIKSAIQGDGRAREVSFQGLIGDLIDDSSGFEIGIEGRIHGSILIQFSSFCIDKKPAEIASSGHVQGWSTIMNGEQIAFILEEDEELRALLAAEAREAGWKVVSGGHPRAVFEEMRSRGFDLLICDSRIPELHLKDFLARLRSMTEKTYRVLVIADARGPADGEAWASWGVDHFLTKPIGRIPLRERLRLMLGGAQTPAGQLRVGNLLVDPRSFDVYVFGERVHLTPNEFKLLEALLSAQGGVLSRDELMARVQGPGIAVVDRAIDTHVFSLRKKLAQEGDRLETVRGSGYRFRR